MITEKDFSSCNPDRTEETFQDTIQDRARDMLNPPETLGSPFLNHFLSVNQKELWFPSEKEVDFSGSNHQNVKETETSSLCLAPFVKMSLLSLWVSERFSHISTSWVFFSTKSLH